MQELKNLNQLNEFNEFNELNELGQYQKPSFEIVSIQMTPTLLCASLGISDDDADYDLDQL